MEHFDVISILLKNIDEIDLVSLQLLYLLKTAAELNNKRLTIDSELAKEDRALIQSAGFENLIIKQHITE